MKTAANAAFDLVFSELLATGFLLESDPLLPSVTSLVTGERMRGSWWSHPKAQLIFNVNERLDDCPEVVTTKLLSGKVTFVHQQLWPELIAIGMARAEWQMKGLSDIALRLLNLVDSEQQLRTDDIRLTRLATKPADAARQLEQKLLVVGSEVHTEKGAHAKLLQTWPTWKKAVGFAGRKKPSLETAIATFEKRLAVLNERFEAKAKLPWA